MSERSDRIIKMTVKDDDKLDETLERVRQLAPGITIFTRVTDRTWFPVANLPTKKHLPRRRNPPAPNH